MAYNLDMTLASFCEQNGIARLCLYGSVSRQSDHADSDIDLLVEFLPGRVPGLLKLALISQQLSDQFFDGREVDLRTASDLSSYFRTQVASEAKELFAA